MCSGLGLAAGNVRTRPHRAIRLRKKHTPDGACHSWHRHAVGYHSRNHNNESEAIVRVLLAEDNASLARATAAILKHGGFEVQVVNDGGEALDALREGDFDAAVLDIMMPVASGLDVLHTVRSQGNPVPILLLTAKTQVEDKVEGLDDGANDYLTKPFDARELIARVKAIARPRSGAAADVTCADLTLHPSSLEACSARGSLRLEPHEFRLLQTLCLAPNTSFQEKRLVERVWGGNAPDGTVQLYVSYLNSKLSAIGSTQRIQTASDGGWRLEDHGAAS